MATINNNIRTKFHGFLENEYTALGIDWKLPAHTKTTHKTKKTVTQERKLTYRFYSHFHPYVQELITELIENSTAGLQAADTVYTNENLPNGKPKPKLYEEFFAAYNPDTTLIPNQVDGSDKLLHPVKDLDFSSSGAYAVYNWELFYHVPFTIALHLSKNQRFEDAMRWFHYIFDPTDDSDFSTPERFWKVKPFQQTDVKLIEDILTNLSSGADPELQRDTFNSIQAWKNNPFKPHPVARYRQTAYMYKSIMAYLDNLIEWGDSLFRQDSGEAINEAMQLYILAANILGPRPQAVPKKGSVKPQTYAALRKDLDAFGNALREIEVDIPFDLAPIPGKAAGDEQVLTLKSIGQSLYFCIPQNAKLLGYWDTVADRLYKIRNSLNLQGVFRQLPLFDPPIDPALLARAAAAGLDTGAVINGLNQPLPLIRFRSLVQKAYEICQEVKSLGNGILSTIEKEDNEALAFLRAKHDVSLQKLAETLRYAQWQEAIKNREGLEVSLKNTIMRYAHYERQLGNAGATAPAPESLDEDDMNNFRFSSREATVTPRNVSYDLFAEALDAAGLGDINSLRLNTPEALAMILDAGTIPLEAMAIGMDVMGGLLTIIPEMAARVTPIGVGAGVSISGEQLGKILQLMGSATRGGENILKTISGISSSIANYTRRKQEWELQSQQISGEINQIYKQLVAAQIRELISKKEYDNHKSAILNAQEIEDFLNGEKVNGHSKTTTLDFYTYQKREVKSLHNKYFKFAFDISKKAERALQHELGNTQLTYLQFDYLAGREGLFAGEKLGFDIKRMEMAYHEMNVRELELTKHISLVQISPMSLLQLRLTGRCTVSFPEEIFDMGGCEGHYFRRIKSVSISIPCIAGPYTSINCTATLTKSSIRTRSHVLNNEYERQDNDDRFSDNYGSESIVTSSAQNDNGLFEFNMNDERYLPFEYAGVISEWTLEFATDFPQFDYNTISDIIFHFRYTARQGGGSLKTEAIKNINKLISERGNQRLFLIKHEFPSEWHRFISRAASPNNRFPLSIRLKEEHYPFWSKGLVDAIDSIQLFAVTADGEVTVFASDDDNAGSFTLPPNAGLGENIYSASWDKDEIPFPQPIGEVTLHLDKNTLTNLWMIVNWKKE